MKWELPKEERKFRDVGKLKIPEFKVKEEGPHTKDVGKLKWGGVSTKPNTYHEFIFLIKSTLMNSLYSLIKKSLKRW